MSSTQAKRIVGKTIHFYNKFTHESFVGLVVAVGCYDITISIDGQVGVYDRQDLEVIK